MNGAGLPDTLYADMVKQQGQGKDTHYTGLGWGVVRGLPGGAYALQHGGSDIGVRTMAIFLPNTKDGIVVMTNGDNGGLCMIGSLERRCLWVGRFRIL